MIGTLSRNYDMEILNNLEIPWFLGMPISFPLESLFGNPRAPRAPFLELQGLSTPIWFCAADRKTSGSISKKIRLIRPAGIHLDCGR